MGYSTHGIKIVGKLLGKIKLYLSLYTTHTHTQIQVNCRQIFYKNHNLWYIHTINYHSAVRKERNQSIGTDKEIFKHCSMKKQVINNTYRMMPFILNMCVYLHMNI